MYHPDELERIGSRIRERDERAFHDLYRSHFAGLCRYAGRYVYDAREAEDIVQEAYLSLWNNAGSIRPGQNVVAYLLVIVKNECFNYLRHLKIKDSHQDKLVEAMLFAGIEEPDVEPEARAELQRLLALLPGQGYRVITEHVLRQRTIGDIAAEMQIAESTVKTHLKRAMKTLRNAIRARSLDAFPPT
ncbi:MAG: sigma-70 family RNA polymerase sigma factor [Odoribacteraceae bacterium]|jgi:RNA polymerase sigma-70 factor (ECF subfamily)|nr:sigma-70 family RNA polymerase sigma factor [Odoribacteraceae bacterium]